MATGSFGGLSLHNPKGIDIIDSVLSPFFVAASFVMTNLATISLDVFGASYGLSDVLWASNGTEITTAFVIVMATIAIAWITNEVDLGDLERRGEGWYKWVPIAMIAANVLLALVPALNDLATGSDLLGIVVVMLNGAGFYLIAYF